MFAATPEDVSAVTEERGEFGGRPREDLWEMEELLIDGNEDCRLHHFVRQFGRGADGEVYILANRIGVPQGDTGVVLEIVPPGEGVTIEPPEEVDDELEDPDEDSEDEHPGADDDAEADDDEDNSEDGV